MGSPFQLAWARLRGYDQLTELVMRRVVGPDSLCVDVGCCRGDVLRRMLRCAPRVRALAFEPIPNLHRQLVRDFPGVEIFPTALSDQAGEAQFHWVTSNPGYSGLRRRTYSRPEQVTLYPVRTERLDDVLARLKLGPVRFLKIDVEGAECLVLRGARECLRSRPYVAFEHGRGASDHYGHGPRDLYPLLQEAGLEVSLLDDWLLGKPPLGFDGLLQQYEQGLNWYFLAHPTSPAR